MTTTTLPRFEGDPEPRFVLDLSRGLGKWFDVVVLAPSYPGAPRRDRLAGVDVVRFRYAPDRLEVLAYPGAILPRLRARPWLWALVPALLLGQAWATYRILRRERFDVVHCHWIVPQGLLLALMPRRLRPPFVVTSHGGDIHGVVGRSLARLVRFTLSRAAAVTAVSQDIDARLRRIMDGTARPPCVIPMGVDLARFRCPAAGARRVAELSDGGPVVLFVGRLVEKKGVVHLLRALGRGESALDGAVLAVVGDGPLRAELEAEAERLRLRPRVRFLGAIAHDALPRVLASADIFCLPSVVAADGDTDGLPVTLLEAAASGLPIVATRVGGVPDLITDGVDGLLVDPADPAALARALSRLAGDASVRLSLGAAAGRRAQAFSWEAIARRYAETIAAAGS